MADTETKYEQPRVDEINGPEKLLVTGANGFIGRSLIDSLCRENYEILALVSSFQSRDELVLHLARSDSFQEGEESTSGKRATTPSVTILVADITNRKELTRQFRTLNDEPLSVVHLAGLAHVGREEESKYHLVNTEGTLNVIKSLEEKVIRFIYLSSSLAAAAESNRAASTSYGKSKLDAEIHLRDIADAKGIQLGILRPCNIYGTGMKGNLRTLIRLIRRGILPPLPNYRNRLSLVSDSDVVRAIQLQLKIESLKNKPYYITDGRIYSTKEIETEIYNALRIKIPKWKTPNVIIYLSIRALGLLGHLPGVNHSISRRTYENLVSDNLFSNEDAQADLGFSPTTDFYKELRGIVEAV
ncbi:MAG: hypothetical protein DHS20C12_27760 [Pseudohongiella sp.]|nr:MAG: hypothetical protein DHS20C12_27760 [Pseudohongiella sp.]